MADRMTANLWISRASTAVTSLSLSTSRKARLYFHGLHDEMGIRQYWHRAVFLTSYPCTVRSVATVIASSRSGLVHSGLVRPVAGDAFSTTLTGRVQMAARRRSRSLTDMDVRSSQLGRRRRSRVAEEEADTPEAIGPKTSLGSVPDAICDRGSYCPCRRRRWAPGPHEAARDDWKLASPDLSDRWTPLSEVDCFFCPISIETPAAEKTPH